MERLNPYATPEHPEGIVPGIRVPKTIAGILLAGLSLYVANAPAVIGVILIVWLPVELMKSYYDYFIADAEDIGGSFRTTLLIENLIGVLPIAGIIAIGDAAMQGQRPSLWFGLRSGLEAWPRMIGTRIVVSLITLLALVLFIVPAIYVGVRSLLAEPVAVIERLNGMTSMKRSFELTHGSFWRYFVLGTVSIGFLLVVSVSAGLPTAIFPEIDHWLLNAGLSLLVDLVAGWVELVFVAAYWASARRAIPIQDEPAIAVTPT